MHAALQGCGGLAAGAAVLPELSLALRLMRALWPLWRSLALGWPAGTWPLGRQYTLCCLPEATWCGVGQQASNKCTVISGVRPSIVLQSKRPVVGYASCAVNHVPGRLWGEACMLCGCLAAWLQD